MIISNLLQCYEPYSLTDQVLVVDRVSLVASQVVEELLQVCIEGELPRSVGGDKAENFHVSVGADVEIPVETSNVHCRHFASDGVYTTYACKPGKNQFGFET